MGEIVVVDDAGLKQELAERATCNDVGLLLATTYPGYRWRVEADVRNGIVDIRCEMTNCRFAYTLIPERYFSETQWRAAIIKAGGEILERYGMSRRNFDAADFIARKRDFAGLIHPDL